MLKDFDTLWKFYPMWRIVLVIQNCKEYCYGRYLIEKTTYLSYL
jgi:hypothetical protein